MIVGFALGVAVSLLFLFACFPELRGRWYRPNWRTAVKTTNDGEVYVMVTKRPSPAQRRGAGAPEMMVAALRLSEDSFDDRLAQATSTADERAAQLNSTQRRQYGA